MADQEQANQDAVQIDTEYVTLTIADGTQMPAYVAHPKGKGKGKGLLILQEAFGVNAHMRDITERFAREGYTSIAPALFHRTDPSFEGSYTDFQQVLPHLNAVTDEGQEADVRAAYVWLTAQAGASAVGSIGYCLGGRTSFLTDTVLPVQASVSYYGGGITMNSGRPDLLPLAEKLHAPILLFWGGKDSHIGPEVRRAVEDGLIAAGKPFEVVTFSEADHGFFCDARASYNPVAAHQAWALTLAFLENYLGTD